MEQVLQSICKCHHSISPFLCRGELFFILTHDDSAPGGIMPCRAHPGNLYLLLNAHIPESLQDLRLILLSDTPQCLPVLVKVCGCHGVQKGSLRTGDGFPLISGHLDEEG